VTAFFWITKLLTTAMGESTPDFLVHRIDPVVAVGLGAVGLVVALTLQFARRTYSTWSYWLAVVMVAVSGTLAADVLHIRFRIPLPGDQYLLRHHPRGDLHCLVRLRAHAVHPQHLHPAA
jgi:uncharacterized membrane-anchored protein